MKDLREHLKTGKRGLEEISEKETTDRRGLSVRRQKSIYQSPEGEKLWMKRVSVSTNS
jgi:hypothetical protein